MFDRRTDQTPDGDVIDSAEPLLAEIHNAFLELDRKYQKYDPRREPGQFRLTDAEKRALSRHHHSITR